jgi:hypothetical protein
MLCHYIISDNTPKGRISAEVLLKSVTEAVIAVLQRLDYSHCRESAIKFRTMFM